MACTGIKTPTGTSNTRFGMGIVSGPKEVKEGGHCYNEYMLCTSVDDCTILWSYNPPCSDGGAEGHSTPLRRHLEPIPCPPPIDPPSANDPRTVERCVGSDLYSFTIDTDGIEGPGTLVGSNHASCVKDSGGGDVKENITCQVYPGTPPAADGGGPWSPVPAVLDISGGGPGWEYAMGAGQAGSFPCWRRRPTTTRPHPPGPDFKDLLVSVIYPSGTEYIYSIHRSGIKSLNAPLFFKERSIADWVKDPMTTTADPETSASCIPVSFGPLDKVKEVKAYFTISQQIVADIFLQAKLWAINYYYECENQIASQLPFLKSYFPLYVDNAVSSRQNYPSEYLTTWTLAGGVEVVIPTFLFAKAINTFYMNNIQSKRSIGTTFQDCGDGPTVTPGWDYLAKVWSTFEAKIYIPRCIVPEGGTMNYHIDLTFSLPSALTVGLWNVVNDRAGVDLCITTPGCTKKNNQIMVYEKPNDYSVFDNLPVSPPFPNPPVAPIEPTDPMIKFVQNESEQITYESPAGSGNFVTQITYITYVSRPGFPNTYYVTPDVYQQQALVDAGIPLPSPLIFLWRKNPPSPILSPPLDFLQEPGYPDPKPIYLAQQNSLMAYYQECIALKAAYEQQRAVYMADLADYNDSMTFYNNHTYPDWVAADNAAKQAYADAAGTIGVGVAQTTQEKTKGGLYLDESYLP